MRLQPGDPAPAFTAVDFNGQTRQLSDFVIAPNQTVSLAYHGRDVGDHLPLETIHLWLEKPGPEAIGKKP